MTRPAAAAFAVVLALAAPSAAGVTTASVGGPWSGSVHYTRTATLHTSTVDASENVSLEITIDNGAATGVGKVDFQRTATACGRTLTHEAHGTATHGAGLTLQSAGAGKYNVFVGSLGVAVNETEDDCKGESRTATPTWVIETGGVLGVAGNPDTDATLSGSVSRDQSQGCQGIVGSGTAYASCQETLSWDLA